MHGTGTVERSTVRTGRFRALRHDFAIETPDAALARYLDTVLSGLAAAGHASATYRLEETADGRLALLFEGEEITASSDPAHALGTLLWHVNQQAVAQSAGLVRLHAAGAARDGRAVVLPAPMECGKTTLVAGLVRAGLDYLSDEVVALEPTTLAIRPYPKPLSIDPGSWEVLGDFEPTTEPAVRRYLPQQWQVPADAIRPAAVAAGARPVVIVSPRYRPDEPTRIEPVGRAEMVGELVASTFTFDRAPARNLEVLGRLAATVQCYRLSVADLDEAVALVIPLLPADSEPSPVIDPASHGAGIADTHRP